MYIRYLYVFENKTRWVPNVTQAHKKIIFWRKKCVHSRNVWKFCVTVKRILNKPPWVPDVTQASKKKCYKPV